MSMLFGSKTPFMRRTVKHVLGSTIIPHHTLHSYSSFRDIVHSCPDVSTLYLCRLALLRYHFSGNALQLDTKRPWLTYTAWGKTYRKIIHSCIFGIDLIIINSETIARELLDRRSGNYSTRPVIRTNELAGVDFSTMLLPYGETLRRHRKIFHQVLKAEVSVSHYEMYSRHANELVVNLLDTISDPQHQTETCAASLIMAVTYGYRAHGHEDPFLSPARELLDIGKYITSPEKAAMFTAFPFLEKLPFWCFGGAFALMGRSRELAQQLLNEPFNEVKAQMANGTASHSLVADFLSQAHDDADEDTMKAVALTGYMVGMDTSAAALQIFLLTMVLYPDVQARARAEIDQAVKHDKMPCLDERASMPYLDAILRDGPEMVSYRSPRLFRSNIALFECSTTCTGIPHATSNDDVYDGYFIPKGAMVVVNQWHGTLSDENIFPDASCFDPSRHLTADGKLKDPFVNHFALGHGRCICPGRWFAENSLWTATAAILTVLRIDHAKDSNGNRIEVKPEFTAGLAILRWILNDEEIDALLKATENLTPPSSKCKKRRPYTIEFICTLQSHLNPECPLDVAVFSCLTSAFYCTARVGEFTIPTLTSFNPNRHVKPSDTKTSITDGEDVLFAKQNGPSDPERAFLQHIAINNPPPGAALFAYRYKNGHRPLTKQKFITRLARAARAAGMDPLQGHGIRIGSTLEYLL
ncbi:cytochrome P450 [Suillus variegatus]|nr:cytochrome P450 [Suillus variegatus]